MNPPSIISRRAHLAAFSAAAALCATTYSAPPAAPTNFSAEAPFFREFQISWDDNATDEDYYRLDLRVPPETNWSAPLTFDPDTTGDRLTGGAGSTTYDFRIVAVNADGEAASEIATVTTPDSFSNGEFLNAAPFAHISLDETFSFTPIPNNFADSTGITFTASPLPAGLTIDPDSGEISGQATEDGYFDVIIEASYTDPVSPAARDRLALRITPALSEPILQTPLAATPLIALSPATNTPLDSHFVDPDTSVAVSIDTTEGTMVFSLFDRAMPDPVANFLIYVDAGSYSNNVFHRSVNAGSFDIIQSGGFAGDSTNLTRVATAPATPPITNAPGIPNDRGTLAYARTDDPNSATSGWYINAQDSPGLDGGESYSVFGRATTPSLSAIDTIHAFPTIPKPADNDPSPPPQATTFLSRE